MIKSNFVIAYSHAHAAKISVWLNQPCARLCDIICLGDAIVKWQSYALPFLPLTHRNYRLFFLGQSLSLIGTWMQTVAQQWLIYRLTGSAAMLGIVGFLGQLPVLLLAPFGGILADQFQKRSLLLITQLLFTAHALTFALLTLTKLIRVWHIPMLALIFGLISAVDIPTRHSFISELVPKGLLINAIALNSAMFNMARVAGPAAAGIVVAGLGEGWCFLINGASYFAIILGLLMMDLPGSKAQNTRLSPLSHLVEGVKFVVGTAPIRRILALLGLVSLTGMSYVVLMPVFADRILHVGPKGLGILMAASGTGALVGALLLAMHKGVVGLDKRIAFGAVGFGTSLILFSHSRSFALSTMLLISAGFCMITQMASSNTLVQTLSPEQMRGRVMAAYAMMLMGMAPLGSLLAGTMAHFIGAQKAVVINGFICVVGGLVFARCLIYSMSPKYKAS
ncbi:MAG: MFS transporter [Armatimonadota bacterium]|nr:MFS transporter [Armatimonadota bacterium]MCX7777676.1 MFS transporter [Armatimonadota bacterium]MDW8025435.1 MFS transporter [Armatimonadota bacterium]